MTLQGFPPAIQSAGISLTTTLPAAIIVLAPIETPLHIIVLAPTKTSSPIFIGAVLADFLSRL